MEMKKQGKERRSEERDLYKEEGTEIFKMWRQETEEERDKKKV